MVAAGIRLKFAMLKIGGKWYPVVYEIDGDDCYASFLVY
jgi:hypothetical protein